MDKVLFEEIKDNTNRLGEDNMMEPSYTSDKLDDLLTKIKVYRTQLQHSKQLLKTLLDRKFHPEKYRTQIHITLIKDTQRHEFYSCDSEIFSKILRSRIIEEVFALRYLKSNLQEKLDEFNKVVKQ